MLTWFQNICRVKSQIFVLSSFHISLSCFLYTLSILLSCHSIFYISLASIVHINMHVLNFLLILSYCAFCLVFLYRPLVLVTVCLRFSCSHHNQLFIPVTFSLHYPIIPLYRSISPFPASFIYPFSF